MMTIYRYAKKGFNPKPQTAWLQVMKDQILLQNKPHLRNSLWFDLFLFFKYRIFINLISGNFKLLFWSNRYLGQYIYSAPINKIPNHEQYATGLWAFLVYPNYDLNRSDVYPYHLDLPFWSAEISPDTMAFGEIFDQTTYKSLSEHLAAGTAAVFIPCTAEQFQNVNQSQYDYLKGAHPNWKMKMRKAKVAGN